MLFLGIGGRVKLALLDYRIWRLWEFLGIIVDLTWEFSAIGKVLSVSRDTERYFKNSNKIKNLELPRFSYIQNLLLLPAKDLSD